MTDTEKVPEILIVEDERLVAEDIRISLETMGYKIGGMVSSGEEALKQLETNQPDLILMDIVLQGKINGIMTADQIRSFYDIPIIYLTAYADSDTIEKAKKTEPYGYILKPFEDQEVHSAIEMVLYRHKMEKKLRKNENWLSSLLKSFRDAVVATDQDGLITYLNQAARDLFECSDEDVLSKPFDTVFKFTHELDETDVISPFLQVIEERQLKETSSHQLILNTSKEKLHVEYRGSIIFDNRDTVVGVVIVIHDITKRRKAEITLQRVIHEESVLLNAVSALIYLVDLDYQFVRVNQAFAETLHKASEQILGYSFSDFFPKELAEQYKSEHDQVVSSGKALRDVEECIETPEGLLWLSTDKIPFYDSEGNVIGVIVLSKDITERKKAQEILLRRNEQLHTINEIATTVGRTLDLETIASSALSKVLESRKFVGGVVFLFNPLQTRAELFLHQNIDDSHADAIQVLIEKSPAYRQSVLQGIVMQAALTDFFDDLKESSELQLTDLDNFTCIVVPIKEGDRVLGAFHFCERGKSELPDRDILFYDSLGFQTGLAIQNAMLYQEAEKALKELKITQDKLLETEKMAVLGRLTSNVVHEIGNPLAAIMNSVDVLALKLSLDGKLKELMDIIRWETERLSRTIDELREFSRPRVIQREYLQIEEIIRKAIVLLNQDLDLTWQRRIRTQYEADLPSAWADPDAIEQVLLNLLKNALQAIDEDKEIKVKLSTRFLKEKSYICIQVIDNGPGMSEDVRKRLFEPYFTTKARGMGLGMYIVKQIIDAHNGVIRTRSVEGKGTSISVYLPVNEETNGNHTRC